MIEIENRRKILTDKEQWAARGASFVAKVKATKLVWFPPKPTETRKKAATAGKRATNKTAKKTTGVAKKTTSKTKKAAAPASRKKN